LCFPVKLKFNLLLLLGLFFTTGCFSEFISGDNNNTEQYSSPAKAEYSSFTIPQQLPPPEYIKSILFYREANVGGAPIIRLHSNQKLTLEFDAIVNRSEQYRIEFTHHNKNWERSNLMPNNFIEGFEQTFITGGQRSRPRDPLYFHFTYTFPNQQVQFRESGNYQIHVFDNATGEKLFNLPFFVHENEGKISSIIERLFNSGQNGRPLDQPFSTFEYPDFVEFPQFDLSFAFAQNQLWGTAKITETFDTSVPGEVRFHLPRNKAYPADFEFNILDLSELKMDGIQILDFQPRFDPPRIILNQDVQNFASEPSPVSATRFGIPDNRTRSRYAEVFFSFEPREPIDPDTEIYLVGDFNQWQIQGSAKLTYDVETGYWKTNTLIKQGKYSYKYLLVDESGPRPLFLDDGFIRNKQEYTAFVYFNDPNYRFDRLLQVDVFYSD